MISRVRNSTGIIVFLLLFSFLFSSVYADGPNKLNYQGKLSKDGIPVSAIKSIGYIIYKGSSSAWLQEPHDITISNGLFSDIIDLSSGFIPGYTVKTLFDNYTTAPCSLEVWVGEAGEGWGESINLSPKEILLSVPHAQNIADSVIRDTKIDWSVPGSAPEVGEVSADDIPLNDISEYFTTDNVEAALQELGSGTIGNNWIQSGGSLHPNDLLWNIGIGTSSPTEKLDLEGNIELNSNQIKNLATPTTTNSAIGQGVSTSFLIGEPKSTSPNFKLYKP